MAIAYPVDESVPTRNWRTLLRHVPLFPSLILGLLLCTAVCAAFLAPHSPTDGDINAKPSATGLLATPRYLGSPSGTDRFLGRDVLSRIIYGSQVSLIVSLLTIGAAGTLGALGVADCRATAGGLTDADPTAPPEPDIGLSLPTILIAVVLLAVSEPSFR